MYHMDRTYVKDLASGPQMVNNSWYRWHWFATEIYFSYFYVHCIPFLPFYYDYSWFKWIG